MTTQLRRAALYARVSTKHDQDPEVQLRELRPYAISRGWNIAAEHVDHGVSGAKDSRPALNALLDAARRRKIDLVIVWALDRLGRSLRHLVLLVEELAALGVDLVVLTQPIDTTTPTGKLTFSILGAVAEFEREIIRSRVKAGVDKARATGKRLGRPPANVDVSRLRSLRGQGLSVREIARHVGVSKSAVSRLLAG